MRTHQHNKTAEAISDVAKLADLTLRLARKDRETRPQDRQDLVEERIRVHFWKISAHLYSIRRILLQCCEESIVWDVSGVATLARAIVDAALGMAYWRDNDAGEFPAKLVLHHLHENMREHQILLAIGSSAQDEIDARAAFVAEARMNIESQPLFLEDGRFDHKRSRALKGDLPRLLTNNEIAQRAGLNVAQYDATWRLLSSYVHAHPHALSWLETFDASDPASARLVRSIARFPIQYGSWAVIQFADSFGKCAEELDADERWNAEVEAGSLRVDLSTI